MKASVLYEPRQLLVIEAYDALCAGEVRVAEACCSLKHCMSQ